MKIYKDPKTNLLIYNTLDKPGSTDAEVDSSYLTCYYHYFSNLLSQDDFDFDFAKAMVNYDYKHESGIFRRYPTEGLNKVNAPEEAKFNNSCNLSRDNTIPLIIACGHFGHTLRVKRFMFAMLKRGSFFQNTHTHKGEKKFLPDLATPDHWATFIRAYYEATSQYSKWNFFTKAMLWILLNILDVFSIFQTTLHVLHTRFVSSNHTGSELNFFASCLQRRLILQTPCGWMANKIYFKWRAFPSEVAVNGAYTDRAWIAAVENFFSRGRRFKIMPELDALVRELDKKFKF